MFYKYRPKILVEPAFIFGSLFTVHSMILPSYRLLPRILRWFRRFRQRRGYGVHSPFAFEWITDVVYLQKAQYYAYAPLAEQHEAWQGVLSVKDARLLFRIANHQRAQRMLSWGRALSAKSTISKQHALLRKSFICPMLPLWKRHFPPKPRQSSPLTLCVDGSRKPFRCPSSPTCAQG